MKKPFFIFLIILALFSCKQNSTEPTGIDSIVVGHNQFDSLKSVNVFYTDSVLNIDQIYQVKISLSSDINGDMFGYNLYNSNGNLIDSTIYLGNKGTEFVIGLIRYYVMGNYSISATRQNKTTKVSKIIATNKFRVIVP